MRQSWALSLGCEDALEKGRSPEEANGKQLQYSCLENPIDRGAWQATVHGVARARHDLATKPPPPTLLLKEREIKNTKVEIGRAHVNSSHNA